MSHTIFVNSVTISDASWFQDVDTLTYLVFTSPADLATARNQFFVGGTTTSSSPIPDVTQTWNSSVAFTGARYRITDTTSLPASYFVDYQRNTSSLYRISKAGWLESASSGSFAGSLSVSSGITASTMTVTTLTVSTLAIASSSLVANLHAASADALGSSFAYGRVVRTQGNLTTSSTLFQALTGASITVSTGARNVMMNFTGSFFGDSALQMFVIPGVDSVVDVGTSGFSWTNQAGGVDLLVSFHHLVSSLAASTHTFDLRWKVNSGTTTLRGSSALPYEFSVQELP